MKTLDELLRLADADGIPVLEADLPTVESCSVLLPDWSCAVGIDPPRKMVYTKIVTR